MVRICAELRLPFVARGAGTGLSGGALPRADGVLIVTSKMRRIIAVDPANRRATVEPGVHQSGGQRGRPRAFGYYYAPDPSSQQVCTIGGNVAENSGGAHCLKYGFTVNHMTGLEIVTPAGDDMVGDAAASIPATTCWARSSARRARSASRPGSS